MSTIKQLILLHRQGHGIKATARSLGISKNTVRAYLTKLHSAHYDLDALLRLDDPVLEAKFHAGSPAYTDARHFSLINRMDYFIDELKRKGVTKRLLWEEYQQGNDTAYGYSQFCYHLQQYAAAKKPTMVLHHEPAEQLMIDFAGTKASYIDAQTGEVIQCEVFVGILPCSNYCFVKAVPSQKVEYFIQCVVDCLHFLGGVPKAIIPDNLKSAVTKSSRIEPTLNKAFEDMANHFGCSIVPARALKPRDKAAVEGLVKIVYTQVLARLRNRQFFSMQDLNIALREMNTQLNQRRLKPTELTREERFFASEKPHLQPLPQQPYQIKYYAQYKVAQNNHIRLTIDAHYYSVPYAYIGKKVQVIYTAKAVRIYHNHQLIASHFRARSLGKYSTQSDHLCSNHQHYLSRSPQYYIDKSQKISATVHEFFTKLFNQPDKYPEQLYRTCDGLLHRYYKLKSTLEKEHYNAACQCAMDIGVYTYQFIDNYLRNNMAIISPLVPVGKSLPLHTNIRGKENYS